MTRMNQKGYSLMEIIVVIFIISVAATIVVAQYSGIRNSKALSLGARQVANDVRVAQNYTFSALEAGGVNPSGGYGIRFFKNSNSYIIFADKDSDKARDAGGSEDFQTINLPNDVKITSLIIDANSYDEIDVVFTSPYGEVYINGNNKDAGDNFINLEVEIGNSAGVEIINVNSSRRIN